MSEIIEVLRASGWDEELLEAVKASVEIPEIAGAFLTEPGSGIQDLNEIEADGPSSYTTGIIVGGNAG